MKIQCKIRVKQILLSVWSLSVLIVALGLVGWDSITYCEFSVATRFNVIYAQNRVVSDYKRVYLCFQVDHLGNLEAI